MEQCLCRGGYCGHGRTYQEKIFWIVPIGLGSYALTIPTAPGLIGTRIYTQAACLDVGLNASGYSISDAAVMLVGN